jgi:hypothetical protein
VSLVKGYFGRTKSGKSHRAELDLKKRSKVIVYDFAHCFTGKVTGCDFSVASFSKLIRAYGGEKNRSKKFKIIFRKTVNITHQEAVERLSHFVQFLGRSYGLKGLPENDLLVFLVDEACKCITKKSDDKVRLLAQAGRHENVELRVIAQRPMNLHPDVRDMISEANCFKCAENAYYKEILEKKGNEALKNLPEFSFLKWKDDGTLLLIDKKGRSKCF